jgi:hypothetical protein
VGELSGKSAKNFDRKSGKHQRSKNPPNWYEEKIFLSVQVHAVQDSGNGSPVEESAPAAGSSHPSLQGPLAPSGHSVQHNCQVRSTPNNSSVPDLQSFKQDSIRSVDPDPH